VIVLEVKSVTKKFGGLEAVKDMEFNVKKGEILGLIGPNGAGKTTLFNVITGFYKPDKGKIYFRNRDITGLKPEQICRLGIARTFQIVKPLWRLTVLENVLAAVYLRYEDRETATKKAMQCLEFVNLHKKANLFPSELSYPDLKKLELARALATEPTLLLLDETAAGLNPVEIEEMIKIIKKLHENGITFIIVEHVMKFIMNISDRIIVMHHGSKLAEGKPDEVANNRKVIEAYLGEGFRIA